MRFRYILTALLMSLLALSPASAREVNLYSVNIGSFAYHLIGDHGLYTEKFGNHFFQLNGNFPITNLQLFSRHVKKSYGYRGIALGVRRDWIKGKGWALKGVYKYTGEFFSKSFSECGNEGVYHSFKKATRVGFAPCIYHAAQYNFTDYFGIESGIISPTEFKISKTYSEFA